MTFVDGFDQNIGGGIPEGSIVLISGYPGTMKSSLVLSIMHENSIKRGMKGAYISLEQSGESLIRQMSAMGIDIENDDNIRIVDLSSLREELEAASVDDTLIAVLKEYVNETLQGFQCNLFALDSLDVLEMFGGSLSRRSQIYFLFEWLREMGFTSFLISESNPDEVLDKGFEEGYLADGIIHLLLGSGEEDAVKRRIRCIKLRNTMHETSYLSLRFDRGRFLVTEPMG